MPTKMNKDLKIPVIISEVKARLVLEIEPVVKVNGKITRILTTPDTKIELIQGEMEYIIRLLETWKEFIKLSETKSWQDES